MRILPGIGVLVFFILAASHKTAAQETGNHYYRGDHQVSFKWRYGYSEFPLPDDPVSKEDALRGVFGWYDGSLWSQSYRSWDGTVLHGTQLLFRGGSPYAREIKCTSEIVPYKEAGSPVSFLVPFMYTIGSEESLAFSFSVKGTSEETIACKLRPQGITSFVGGLFKVNFITLSAQSFPGPKPATSVTGMMHIRVYPQMMVYGGRMDFRFSSATHHMDVESSLVLGSLYKNVSGIDPYSIARAKGVSDDSLAALSQRHDSLLEKWNTGTAAISKRLTGKGKVEVICNGAAVKRDRGELRVTAYSGNPVKDFQYGPPSGQMKEMARAVTDAIGRKFSLFRYQHHYLPWKIDNPAQLDSSQIIYLRQWLEVAGAYADSVILALQISPIIALYKQYSQMGQLSLPAAGIPGAEWDKIKEGFLTTLVFAKKVCPALRIVQMPYEFDNISTSQNHADAHYRLYQCLYEAVAVFNKDKAPDQQIRIAGLGGNNPFSRWDFVKNFLARYTKDRSADKRLDYLTWHTYLFPGHYPAMVRGVADSLKNILAANRLPQIPVIIDELGLAEPSTIEDLSDLQGAMKKEAAMACYTSAIQDYYAKEQGPFIPISGAGWHFALLTYGRQAVLSTYAKGMVLRSKLGEMEIPATATPADQQGFGLHAIATKEGKKISVLVFCASPSVFYSNAAPLNYPQVELLLKDLPDDFKNQKLKVTYWNSSPDDEAIGRILSKEKYQTLPLTRGADRYDKDFRPEEVRQLNTIPNTTTNVRTDKNTLSLTFRLGAYDMRLIEIEPDPGK